MSVPLWKSPELAARLTADLAAAPADPRWRRELAPELTFGRHAGPARSDARAAAVMMVLCWDDDKWSLPLTVRCASLTRHGGQVSLPGGLCEPGETARDAAARELGEELGQHPPLEWLGELAPLFVFASNAVVTPCIAAVDGWPAWIPHPPEVDRVLRLGVRELLELETAEMMEIQRGPLHFWAPRLTVEDQSAWGATAVLLGELRGRMRRIDSEG